jgi:hypothetical protein
MKYPADDKIANQLYLNQAVCEGLQENGFVDLNLGRIMEWLYANQVTAAGHVAILSNSRIAKPSRRCRGAKAFRQVLDNPSAVKRSFLLSRRIRTDYFRHDTATLFAALDM